MTDFCRPALCVISFLRVQELKICAVQLVLMQQMSKCVLNMCKETAQQIQINTTVKSGFVIKYD